MTWAPFSTAPTHDGAKADLYSMRTGTRYPDAERIAGEWRAWEDDGMGMGWVRIADPISHWMPVPAEPHKPAANAVCTRAYSYGGVIVNSTEHVEGYFKHLVVITDVTHSVPVPFELTDAQLTNLQEALTRAMIGRQAVKGL
jgi:hypothetical protein